MRSTPLCDFGTSALYSPTRTFKASYSIWAVYELLERVMDHPLTSADDIINEFALKMELFSRVTDDEEAKLKFRVASDVAEEIMLLFV